MREPDPPLITLTTDVGWSYASQMKGAILRNAPRARIVDMTHEIASHQILEGAFLLRQCAAWYPPGTIHVGIVDPGVGGERRPVAIACRGGTTLLGPDNGLLVPLAEHLGEPKTYHLDPQKVAPGGSVSPTFEGRDLFAPAAARLAMGTPVTELGTETSYSPFQLPLPSVEPGLAHVIVLHVDPFGNAITNLPTSEFHNRVAGAGSFVVVRAHDKSYRAEVARHYESIPQGVLGVVGSSFGLIEVAVNRGRARDVLGLYPGARFSIQRM